MSKSVGRNYVWYSSLMGGCYTKDRDPNEQDTHMGDLGLRIGDCWFNTKSIEMFMLEKIIDGKRIWKKIGPSED